MRAQCCICSDLFDDDTTISALQCGHTFHEECIKKWLKTSNTCPSCRDAVERGKIIKKLFFDKGDEEVVDQGKLTNENNHLKVKLKEKELVLEELEDKKKTLENKLKNLQKSRKEEETMVSSLKTQLQYYQAQQKSLEAEKEEFKKAKRKMIELQNIEAILTGCETDVQELLSNRSRGEASLTEFAKYCAILKSEYEQLKVSRKALKSDFDKFKRDSITKETLLKDTTKEVKQLREFVKKSEEELQRAEKLIDHLKKKVSRLQNTLRSPSANVNQSFIETLTEDSPVISTPVLTAHSQNDILFETPLKGVSDIIKPSPNTQLKQHCQENNVKLMKITSASSQPPAKKQKCDDINTLGSFNIFKKKSGLGDMKSAIRKGYDGLGGHMTFTERQSKPKFFGKRSVSRTTDLKNSKITGFPKLPSLKDA